MALTQDELQSIVNSVLSSIRTNSRTIDQLSQVAALGDNDLIELNGGKAIKASVIKGYITPLIENALSDVIIQQIDGSKDKVPSSSAVQAALIGTIELKDLDNISGAWLPYTSGTTRCRFIVTSGSNNVGVLDVISDDMRHQLTEIFTTHYTINDGVFGASHTDYRVYTYYRSYGIRSPHITNNEWSPWQMLSPEGAMFKGVATPDTNPGTPLSDVFYIAAQGGKYTNFGGLNVSEGLNILMFSYGNSKTGSWEVNNILSLSQTLDDSTNKIPSNHAVNVAISNSANNILNAIIKKIGQPEGFVPLDENGLIPTRFLPSSMDDVKEFGGFVDLEIPAKALSSGLKSTDNGCVVLYDNVHNVFVLGVYSVGSLIGEYYSNWLDADLFGNMKASGREPLPDKVYVDVSANKTYRWSGNRLVIIGSDLSLGYTPNTAYPGNEGLKNRENIEDLQAKNKQIQTDIETLDKSSGNVFNATRLLNLQNTTLTAVLNRLDLLPDNDIYKYSGVILTFKTAKGWETWQWNGNGEFTDTSLWRKLIGVTSIGNVYNLTYEQPLPMGYYTLEQAIEKMFALGLNFVGVQMTFASDAKVWKSYQYLGLDANKDNFHVLSNWQDLSEQGRSDLININNLCGDVDYELSTAIEALRAYEKDKGVSYVKEGIVLTYRRSSGDTNEWETKQFTGKVSQFSIEEYWVDFGGGDIETTDEISKDNELPPTSNAVYEAFQTKPIVNFETKPQDEESLLLQGLNEKGEPVGDPVKIPIGGGGGAGSSSTLTITPETQAVWASFGSRIVLRVAIKSVSYDGGNEILGTIQTISILDATTRLELWSERVNQLSSSSASDFKFTFDFTDFITEASSKDFIIRAVDADGNTRTRTISVTAVDVTCTCVQTLHYTTQSALEVGGREKSISMYRFENNVSTKQGIEVKTEIYYNGSWRTLGTAVVTDTYSHTISINPTNLFGGGERMVHASYPLRIQGTDLASGVKGNIVYTAIMCIDANSSVPVVSLRYSDDNEGKVRLYDNISVDIAAYTPGKTSTAVALYFDGVVVSNINCASGQTYNVSKQVQGYSTDGTKTISIYAQSGSSKSGTITLTVEGSAIEIKGKEGALFAYDFSTRSNSESDHTVTSEGYTMQIDGANWNSNGFVTVLGETALRIAENVKAEIPFAPFSLGTLESNGMAIQFAFSTKSIKDSEAKLCECYDPATGAGFYIQGNEIVLTVLNGTPKKNSVKFKCGEKVTVAVVVDPATKYVTYNGNDSGSGVNFSFVKLYVNGEECAAIGYQPNTNALRQTNNIKFNSEYGDFNLNYFIAYTSYMEWLEAFRNYLVRLTDTAAMVREYDKENVLDTTGKPSLSLMAAKGIPYYVIVAEQETFNNFDYALNGGTNTSDQFACTLFYYNPEHPEVNFKATDVLWRRQGTTSAQRPIKNDRFNFNKKNKQTGKTATVTLLNPSEATELGRKAIEAVKHNKVYVSENGFFVDTITVKVDYSDSSNANDCGVCDMMNATFRALGSSYMTPAQRAFDGRQNLGGGDYLENIQMDHSTKNHPITCFRATRNDLSDAWFHAKGNWKEDKGEQVALGFQDTPGYNLGCLNYGDFIEFFGNKGEALSAIEQRFKQQSGLDTSKVYLISQYCGRDYALYRYKSGAWTRCTGSMKQINGKWVVSGDVLNPVSGYELLQYAGMDWFQGVSSVEDMMAPVTTKSSWVNKLGLAAETYPAWTFYFECMIDNDQLQEDLALGKKVPYDLFNVLLFLNSCDYSKVGGWKTIWQQNAFKYMSLESAMAYTAFTDYLAAVDQRAKNMQPMFFLEDGCSVENGTYSGTGGLEPTRMYLNKVYDCDTCNGADNDGGRDIDPEVDPNKPTDLASGYENPYMGSGSVLFNNMDKQPSCWNSANGSNTISLQSVVNRMRNLTAQVGGRTMSPFSPDGALYFFVEKRLDFWPKVISSYDGERKYIDNTNIANMPYFYALHGLGLTSLPRFIEQRWAIRDGYYQTGDFFTNPLSGRVSAISSSSKIHITAAKTGYFGIGNDASGQLSEVVFLEAGQSHSFTTFAHDVGALLYIYQPGRMSKIDLSEMTLAFHFNDLSKLELAEEIILGGSKHTANTSLGTFEPLSSIVLGDMPFIKRLDVSRTRATSIDASQSPRMEQIIANDTPLTSCNVAQTSPINTLTLPNTITSLDLVNLPNLTYPGGLTFGTGSSITRLMIEGCPKLNTPTLLMSLIETANIKTIGITGLNVTAASRLLKRLMNNGATGIDDTGKDYDETGKCSGLVGRWVMSDLIDDVDLNQLIAYFPELDVRNNQFSKVVFSDDAPDPENISNEENETGYKFSSTSNYVKYQPSGHILRIKTSSPICAVTKTGEGKVRAKKLSDDTLKRYADGGAFDPTDAGGTGVDVMKYIPRYWYKGVNDFVKSEKLLFISSNPQQPLSTANLITERTISQVITTRETCLRTSSQSIGLEPVTVTDTTAHLCKMNVEGMKLLRWPGFNSNQMATVFVDRQERILKVFSWENALSDFMNGDYLVTDIPEGAVSAWMSVPKGYDSEKIIAVDSDNIEAVVLEWIEHKAELIGIYHASIDGQQLVRSVSGAPIRNGDNTQVTNTGWQYDDNGNLTSVSVPSGTMHWTMKDFFNAAQVRGKGYQIQDYESWKDFSVLVYAILGNRDTQQVCGMGGSQNAYTTGGYDELDPNGFSVYPSANGTPFKGNLVWGLQNYMSAGAEAIEYVAMNVESFKMYKRNKYIEYASDPVDYKWKIYDPITDTEREVQGVNASSGYCIGKIRWGLRCDIVPSQMTGDNSKWNQHFTDWYSFSGSRGRAVFRGSVNIYNAYAGAGLVGTGASVASSYSNAYLGARLAFRGEIALE